MGELRARNKLVTLEELAHIVSAQRDNGRAVALCHGCFDIFHFGHLRHFEAARDLSDSLIVTVTPDRYVGKGPGRPVFAEEQRAEVVAGLSAVHWVAINEWQSAVETIRKIKPTIFVKGQEYESHGAQVNPNFIAEAVVCEEVGTRVVFTHEDVSSSTAAVERLRASTR